MYIHETSKMLIPVHSFFENPGALAVDLVTRVQPADTYECYWNGSRFLDEDSKHHCAIIIFVWLQCSQFPVIHCSLATTLPRFLPEFPS